MQALDGTVLPLAGVNADCARLKHASRGSRITAELSLQYVGRVRKWLRACFGAPQISMPEGGEEDNSKERLRFQKRQGPLRERTIMSLTCGENAIDRALAEICVEAAQFDVAGSAWVFATSPVLREYARRRGANSGGAGGAGGIGLPFVYVTLPRS